MNHDERSRRRLLRWVGIDPDARRLPGKLADETPGLDPAEAARLGELYTQRQQDQRPRAEAGRGEPRRDDEGNTYRGDCAHCGALIEWIDCPTGGWWAHDVHPADDHDAEPVAGSGYTETPPERIEDAMAVFEEGVLRQYRAERVTADLHAIDDRRGLEDRYLAVCQQLREVTADRDRLDDANGRLLERIRGLEDTVAAQAGHGPRMAMHGQAEVER